MGVFTYYSEYTSTTPTVKLFKAFVLDANNLIPKIAPQTFKSCDLLEGNGGPGTIKKIVFGEGPHHLKKRAKLVEDTITFVEGCALGYVIYKTETIDEANYIYRYTMIEGDVLGDLIEKICFEAKLVEGQDGGTIIKSTTNYYIKGDFQIDESKIKEGKENNSLVFKYIDTYLQNNPNEYN